MRAWYVAVVLLLLVPVAGGQIGGAIGDVDFLTFHEVTFAADDFQSECDAGGVALSQFDRVFTFSEEPAPAPVGGLPGIPAAVSAGCGIMQAQVPPVVGADLIIVRFQASRGIEPPVDGGIAPPALAGPDARQDFFIRFADGTESPRRAVFLSSVGSQDPQPIEYPFLGNFSTGVTLVWEFADNSPDDRLPAGSGYEFTATVSGVVVEAVSAASADQVVVASHERREGARLTAVHDVTVEVPSDVTSAPAIRVSVRPGLDLKSVVGPDGVDLGTAMTSTGGVLGMEHDDIIVEFEAAATKVIIPQSLVAMHGPGRFVLVFEESKDETISAALLPFSIILLLTPVPFAVLAWLESRAFRREAFGGYARSARNLQYAVVLVLLYYVAVVVSAAAGGRLDLMAIVPVPLEGVLLYVQLFLAGTAFTVLWLVARELYLLVKPRPDVLLNDPL